MLLSVDVFAQLRGEHNQSSCDFVGQTQ